MHYRLLIVMFFILFLNLACGNQNSLRFNSLTNPRKDLADFTMINVNHGIQSDAFLVYAKEPEEKIILIDTGYPSEAPNLLEFLDQYQIKKIDLLFVSHPHKDHYGSIPDLLKHGIKIQTTYFNLPDQEQCSKEIPWGCDYQHILQTRDMLRQSGGEVLEIWEPRTFQFGEVAIRLLYAFKEYDPIMVDVPEKLDINDMSLIMKVEKNEKKLLLTGDLNRFNGKFLAEHGKDLQSDILQVPHHGTEGLAPNSFFDKVNPRYALTSTHKGLFCAERSQRPRTYFESRKVPNYVSGLHGHVSVNFEKEGIKIQTEHDLPTMNLCK